MKKQSKKLYVAYGSNLHLRQMSYRCPDAEVFGTGVVKNHSLTFWGNWSRNGVATILPGADTDVPVAVWEISASDEASLDVYEGYPNLYRKENIEVVMADGSVVTAMVYLMNETYPGGSIKMRDSLPSETYYNTIASGYHSFGFDLKFLAQARAKVQRKVSQRERYSFAKIV